MVRIAVVGAGVGGATLAQCLARHCADRLAAGAPKALAISLFERRPAPDGPDGGALTLQGEGLEVLEFLGLREVFCGGAAAKDCTHVNVVRDALLNALLEGVSEHVTLRCNTEIAALRELPDGLEVDHRPLLTFQDGQWVRNTDPRVQTEPFDVVIGADGNAPASCVARHIVGFDGAQAHPIPMLILQALVPCPGSTCCANDTETYLRAGVHGVVGKLVLCTALGRTGASEVPASGPGGLQPWEVCTVTTVSRSPMENFPHPSRWAAVMKQSIVQCADAALRAEAERIADRAAVGHGGARLHAWVPFRKDGLERWWSRGRCLVALGDAAHLMPPTKGWGANCAMGDARQLADMFAFLCESGLLADPLVDTNCMEDAGHQYETLRREHAAPCIDASLDEAGKIVDRRL